MNKPALLRCADVYLGPLYFNSGASSGSAALLPEESAYNAFGPNRGFLPEDFPYRKIKIIPLKRERMVADFAPGISSSSHLPSWDMLGSIC